MMNNILHGFLLSGMPISQYFPETMMYWGVTFIVMMMGTMIYNALPEPAPEFIRIEPYMEF